MVEYNPELSRFDRSLRGCLVDLSAACLHHRPGADDSNRLAEKYAAEILDPFLRRLALTCLEQRPDDLPDFIQTWVVKQHGPEPEALRHFVAQWLASYVSKEVAATQIMGLLKNFEALEAKHAALVAGLQKLVPRAALIGNPADMEEDEVLKHLHAGRQASEELQKTMQSELYKLRKENESLSAENAKLKANRNLMPQEKQETLMPQEAGKGRRTNIDCINLILQRLMDDPKHHCSSAGQAWAFFEPDDSNQVVRSRFQDKVIELDILTQEEISSVLEYIDHGKTNAIDYEEWKAALLQALAASGELHALPLEDEFNAIMFRIKTKLMAKGMTAKEAFKTKKSLTRDGFQDDMLQLNVGLSKKEIAQLFLALEDSGEIDMEDVENAISEGTESNTLRQVAIPLFKQVGESLIKKSCLEICCDLASPVGSDMMGFDGFVQLIRLGDKNLTLASIMRLWCVVDKCGQGGLGFANIPDLTSNIVTATSPPNTK